MRLNMLLIEGNREYEKMNDVIPIRARTHYLTEQFLYFFSKIDLDGNSKLVICFEEKPKDKKKYLRDEYFHVSIFYVDKDVLEQFKILEKNEFDEYFLAIIVDACSYIARMNGKDKEVMDRIEQAANMIRANKFDFIILQKKLSKVSQDKRFRAKVYRILNCLGELWYVEIEDKKSKNITRYELMDQYTNISKEDFYKKASWQDSKYILKDRLDRETAIIEVKYT